MAFVLMNLENHLKDSLAVLVRRTMRASYKGITSGFQPDNGGSIPPARSTYILYHESI